MALTATKDLLLPATVTGSWPRPTWFTQSLWLPETYVPCADEKLAPDVVPATFEA